MIPWISKNHDKPAVLNCMLNEIDDSPMLADSVDTYGIIYVSY